MSILGRLGTGVLGERIGTARLLNASVLLMAVLLMAASDLLWLVAPSYAWLVAFIATLGLGYSLRIAQISAVLIVLRSVEPRRDPRRLLHRLGRRCGARTVAGRPRRRCNRQP